MQPEADKGCVTVHDKDPDSELPLTSFDVTYTGLAAVKVDKNVLATNFTAQPQRDREKLSKAFN